MAFRLQKDAESDKSRSFQKNVVRAGLVRRRLLGRPETKWTPS
jgi:hypothetical protein